MGSPCAAHGLPTEAVGAQWTGAAQYLCKLIIISARGLPMGSSDRKITWWAAQWAAPTLALSKYWAVGNSKIGFHHASE